MAVVLGELEARGDAGIDILTYDVDTLCWKLACTLSGTVCCIPIVLCLAVGDRAVRHVFNRWYRARLSICRYAQRQRSVSYV